MALGEPHTCLVPNQVAVIILRRGQAQRPKQKNLSRRGLQQIGPAHHFGDLHCGIIDHDSHLICRNIISPPHDEIAKIFSRDHQLLPEMQIAKTNLLPVGHAKPPVHSGRFGVLHCTCRDGRLVRPARAKLGGPRHEPMRSASPGIDRFIIGIVWCARRLSDILPRTRARINHPAVAQLPPRLQIVLSPLALRIGTHRPAAIRSFGPRDSQPAQILDHGLHELRAAALRIQIFIAKDQLPTMLRRTARRGPERARMAQVQ